MRNLRKRCAIFAAFYVLSAGIAAAETADAVLFNGKILTVDADFSVREALAIAHGRVLASGTSVAMKKLAGDATQLIDLGGRTVIPGLTDGHIHGVRAALTFGTEVNWIGVPTLKEALDKIRQAAATRKPGGISSRGRRSSQSPRSVRSKDSRISSMRWRVCVAKGSTSTARSSATVRDDARWRNGSSVRASAIA